MMNNECERVGLPVPRITDNGFMVKVIFKRPSADEYKNDTVNTEKDSVKDTVTLKKNTVHGKKDTVGYKKDTVKDIVEHQLSTGRTLDIDQKDTSSTEKEHQLETKRHQLANEKGKFLR